MPKTKISNDKQDINITIENNLFSKNKNNNDKPLKESKKSNQNGNGPVIMQPPEPYFMREIRDANSRRNMYGLSYNTVPQPVNNNLSFYNPYGELVDNPRPVHYQPQQQQEEEQQEEEEEQQEEEDEQEEDLIVHPVTRSVSKKKDNDDESVEAGSRIQQNDMVEMSFADVQSKHVDEILRPLKVTKDGKINQGSALAKYLKTKNIVVKY